MATRRVLLLIERRCSCSGPVRQLVGTEVVDFGLLIELTQSLVHHSRAQRAFDLRVGLLDIFDDVRHADAAALHVADGKVVVTVPFFREWWCLCWSVGWAAGACDCHTASGWIKEAADVLVFWEATVVET